jgi:hypothetical protein
MQVIASADIAGRQKEWQASKQATVILETLRGNQEVVEGSQSCFASMASVGLPLLRALPLEVYTQTFC